MARNISALIAGLIFGLGLTISQMVNPAKVISFLDVFGHWDPSLAFVMIGGLLVTAVGFRLVTGRQQPLFADRFLIPTNRLIDTRLAIGSILFGVGWGLVGLCPGPAVAAVTVGGVPVFVFVLSMVAGAFLYERFDETGGAQRLVS